MSLLTTVDAQRAEKETTAEARFDYVLKSSSFQEAMATECQQLLEKCWKLGYEALFFDGVFTQDSEGTHRANAQLRNDFYDTLSKIDDTEYSVTIPVDFKLKSNTLGHSNKSLVTKTRPSSNKIKKRYSPSNWFYLKDLAVDFSLRAIDLETQLIAVQQIIKVDDLAATLSIDDEMLEMDYPLESHYDHTNTLETLTRLVDAYIYDIEPTALTNEVAEMLTNTLLNQTNLQISDSNFILRAYGESLDLPDSWEGQANASWS